RWSRAPSPPASGPPSPELSATAVCGRWRQGPQRLWSLARTTTCAADGTRPKNVMGAPTMTITVHVDVRLVRRLLGAQFPRWAGLPLAPVGSGGWDNVIFRLGDDLAVRLPRRARGAGPAGREPRWLPLLAPHLPLPVPVPLGRGVPGEGYPWPWSVCRWLPGETAAVEAVADPGEAATALAGFLAALRSVD